MKTYTAKGYVVGNCWGGGRCGYASRGVEAKTLKKLNEKINSSIEDGTLDSGMGYESVIGAVMLIKTIDTISHNNKKFCRRDYRIKKYGEVPKSWEFLSKKLGRGCI